MRYLLTIIIFYCLAAFAHAQPSATNNVLAPESLNTNKLQPGSTDTVVKVTSTLRGEPSLRRTSPGTVKTVDKQVEDQAKEPGSLRMLGAAVLFMLVIALRRNRSGRP